MDGNLLMVVAGAILSLLFGYVPGLREWFEAQTPVRKAQVMAGLLLAAALAVFLGACYTPWQWGVTCDQAGFWQLVELFFAALVANQAVYLIAVKPTRTAVERV